MWRRDCSFSAVSGLKFAWILCYHSLMIITFNDQGTEDIFNGKNTKAARKSCPEGLWHIAARKLD